MRKGSPIVPLNAIGCGQIALMDHDNPAKPLRPRPAKGFRIVRITGDTWAALSDGQLSCRPDDALTMRRNSQPAGQVSFWARRRRISSSTHNRDPRRGSSCTRNGTFTRSRYTQRHDIRTILYVSARAAPTRSSSRRRLGSALIMATIFFCFAFFGTPSTRKYSSNIAESTCG